VVWIAGVILLAAASTPAFADPTPAASCGRSCGQDTAITRSGRDTPVESCIHAAGCGGGGALTISTTTFVAAWAAAASLVISALAIRRHRLRRRSLPAGSLLAGRLFRPPRFVLGS